MYIEIHEDIQSIKEDWQILEKDGSCHVFQSVFWVSTWFATIGFVKGCRKTFVLLRNEHGLPLLLLPFCIRREHGLYFLEFPDAGVSDYNAALLARSFPEDFAGHRFQEIWPLILEKLPQVDVIRLSKMPADVCGIPNPLLALECKRHHTSGHFSQLPPTYEEYSRCLTPHFKRELRRRRKKLLAMGQVDVEIVRGLEPVRDAFEQMMRYKQYRYADGICSREPYKTFYLRTITESDYTNPNDRVYAHLVCIALNGVKIFIAYRVAFRDRLYGLIFSEDFEKYKSFGLYDFLAEERLKALIPMGLKILDLGLGDEEYKNKWASQTLELYDYEVARSLAGKALYEMPRSLRKALKTTAHKLLGKRSGEIS